MGDEGWKGNIDLAGVGIVIIVVIVLRVGSSRERGGRPALFLRG